MWHASTGDKTFTAPYGLMLAEGIRPIVRTDLSGMVKIRQIFQVIFTFLLLSCVCYPAAPTDPLLSKANATAVTFKNDVDAIRRWCERKELDEEVRLAQDGVLASSPDRTVIPNIPLKSGVLDLDKTLPKILPKEYENYIASSALEKPKMSDEKSLTDKQIARVSIVTMRRKHADELYDLARQAVKKGRGALAMQLAMTALHANPDHAQIRNAFGFYKFKDEWRPAWEVAQLKDGLVDHEKFGWIRKNEVEKYEAGQRYYQGKWITTKEEGAERRTIQNGWTIETENYRIRTDHSLEEGVRFSRKLESLYRSWNMVFYRYRFNDAELSVMLAGKTSPNASHPKYGVIFYSDKQDFLSNHPNLDPQTYQGGAYIKPHCVFYAQDTNRSSSWDQERTLQVMYHEATHQLFAETKQATSKYGDRFNYWIVEGAAMFMQSLRQEGTNIVVGEPEYRYAGTEREFMAKDGFLPTRDMTAVSKRTWVDHRDKMLLYRQADNMFKLLFYGSDGYYRDRLIVYLQQVYSGKDAPDTFEKTLGIEPGLFDKEFARFMETKNSENRVKNVPINTMKRGVPAK